MVKIDVEQYISELKGVHAAEEMDLYSLKKELLFLNECSEVFDDFEKEAASISKETLSRVQGLGLLLKMRKLASELKSKKEINNKLHSFHFSLNLIKNASSHSAAKNAISEFLHGNEIQSIADELNDFKSKLEKVGSFHSELLPKSLDSSLELEMKYGRHLKNLDFMHNRQKMALVSAANLFLKLAKQQLKKFK